MFDRKIVTSIDTSKPNETIIESSESKNQEQKFCDHFIKEGWIKEARFYNDPNNLGINKIKAEMFPESVHQDVQFFLDSINAPILIDDRDNRIINKDGSKGADHRTRDDIKIAVEKYSKVAEGANDFYKRNKLHSNSIAKTFIVADTFSKDIMSENTISLMNNIAEEIKGSDVTEKLPQGRFRQDRYMNELDTPSKLLVIDKYERFLESILMDYVNKYNVKIPN